MIHSFHASQLKKTTGLHPVGKELPNELKDTIDNYQSVHVFGNSRNSVLTNTEGKFITINQI